MKNEDIMSVNSPKASIGGPYAIVSKNDEAQWAIVALEWEETPTLGMRWFDENGVGFPSSRNYPTWIIIPEELHKGILLSADVRTTTLVTDFLSCKISGDELKQKLGF